MDNNKTEFERDDKVIINTCIRIVEGNDRLKNIAPEFTGKTFLELRVWLEYFIDAARKDNSLLDLPAYKYFADLKNRTDSFMWEREAKELRITQKEIKEMQNFKMSFMERTAANTVAKGFSKLKKSQKIEDLNLPKATFKTYKDTVNYLIELSFGLNPCLIEKNKSKKEQQFVDKDCLEMESLLALTKTTLMTSYNAQLAKEREMAEKKAVGV